MRSVSLSAPLRLLGALALISALALATPGCRRNAAGDADTDGPTEESSGAEQSVEPGPPPEDWPRILVTVPGSGPAIYLGHESDAPAVGYVGSGVRVRMESAPVNGRVEVLVGGRLATKGWVPLARLGQYVHQRGRVEGTRAYLGPNDLVGIMGPEGDAMRVEARPWLGGAEFLGPFAGTFPLASLADAPAEGELDDVSPGDCYRLPAGETVTVYERPRGDAVANLPASDPPLAVTVLRERSGWYGVRVGYGPYLTGYVQGALTECGGPLPEPDPLAPPGVDGRPYWMSQEQGALHRVARGTRVRFHGRTIARLRDEGWARELGRQDGGLVDAFIAADDGVAIRGLVPEDSLTLVEGAPEEPEPEPEEEEELPDELQ